MKKITKSDIIHFGLDYLEVIGECKLLENIDFTFKVDTEEYIESNSFPGFEIKKTYKVMNYEYKIILKKGGYDCFAYHKGQKNGKVTTYDFISVYGVAFRIFENTSEIFEFLNNNLNNNKIKRFDLAIDIQGYSVGNIYKKIFNKKKKKGSIFFDNKGKIQTFYIGEKKIRLNKYKLLRCYNKIDDIMAKQKQPIYIDYLKRSPITRIEFEFRSELTKQIELPDLLDKSYIYTLFLSYINGYTELFSKFKYEKIKLSRFIKIIDLNELKTNEIVKSKYLKVFLGYAKTLLYIGTCPVKILLENLLISEQTSKDISKFSLDDFDIKTYKENLKKRTERKHKFDNFFLNQDKND